MHKVTLIALSLLLTVPAALRAQTVDDTPLLTRDEQRDDATASFKRSDRNRDGYLDPHEWEIQHTVTALNSGLSDEEIKARKDGANLVFKQMDTNQDQKISKPEFVGWILQGFDCIDKNRDHIATVDEVDRNGEQCDKDAGLPTLPRQATEPDTVTAEAPITRDSFRQLIDMFWGVDANGDGWITLAEWSYTDGAPPSADDQAIHRQRFALIDLDGDQRVSRAEMEAWLQRMFDCMDENGDGKVQWDESERNKQQCRISVMGMSG